MPSPSKNTKEIPFLPQNTKEVWERIKESDSKINPGLIFQRFLNFQNDISSESEPICNRSNLDGLSQIFKRREDFLNWVSKSPFFAITWEQVLLKNMVIGLGSPSLLENGLTLDKVHGFPFIPGTVLKGVTQDFVLQFEKDDSGKNYDKKHPFFEKVFGAQTPEVGEGGGDDFQPQKGSVIFLDGLPLLQEKESPFCLDITNPHYQKYYSSSGSTYPGDYLAPNPIKFLAVKKGLKFSFCLIGLSPSLSSQDLEQVQRWVSKALSKLGVGGKTRLSYGLFKSHFEPLKRYNGKT